MIKILMSDGFEDDYYFSFFLLTIFLYHFFSFFSIMKIKAAEARVEVHLSKKALDLTCVAKFSAHCNSLSSQGLTLLMPSVFLRVCQSDNVLFTTSLLVYT